jgi:hypothetical protein
MPSSLQEFHPCLPTLGNKFDRYQIFEGNRVCDRISNNASRYELKILVFFWREPQLMSLPYPLLLITNSSPF